MTTTYSLNLTMNEAAVEAINGTGQFITIVKKVQSSHRTAGDVAWLTFAATQTIQVSWQETYYLYATSQSLQAGAVINGTARTSNPALSGYRYVFNSNNLFVNPTPGLTQGTFNVKDLAGRNDWKFGLAQMATIGSAETPVPVPLNVAQVLNNELVTFTPQATVSIFLQSFNNNGVVITEVMSEALTVTLPSTAPSANIGFDNSENTFFQEASKAA
jgi:hypothetical protein